MNILFLNSNRDWGGGEVWLTEIAAGLRSRGHGVHIACHPGSALHRRLGGNPSNLVPMKLSGDFNPINIMKLYRIVRGKRIDLVCVHTGKELRTAGIACMLANIPIIVSIEVDVPIKNTLVNRLFYGKIARGIMVNSYATRNTLLMSAPWLRGQTVHVVWKGIRVENYVSTLPARLREEFSLSESDCILGFIGRLDEQKGIPTLLETMRIVVQRKDRIKLILAGEGNLWAHIEEFRAEHGLTEHIYLAGFREDIPSFLKAVDIVVIPSYWEGFCYAAVEAMAAGKAVIASHTSSIPELVVHNRTGLLVPPRSPEDLAEAIVKLSEDVGARERMGRTGIDRVKKQFQYSTMLRKTEQFFLEATMPSVIERGQSKVRVPFSSPGNGG